MNKEPRSLTACRKQTRLVIKFVGTPFCEHVILESSRYIFEAFIFLIALIRLGNLQLLSFQKIDFPFGAEEWKHLRIFTIRENLQQ